MKSPQGEQHWFLYILECREGSLYTGITTDLEKRLAAHNDGSGARFTSGRRPVKMLYSEQLADRSEATRRELAVKRLSRAEKLKLIKHKKKGL